jgi:predicted Zn-dependent protease
MRDGWIPATAREVVRVSELPDSATAEPRCRETPSPIELAKGVAILGERELRAATQMSDAEESRIGDRLERAVSQSPELRGNWDLASDVARWRPYLQDLVDHVARSTTRNGLHYRIHVVRAPTFNAFALPGGVLGIHTGVLEGADAVRDEAELATVLGHEIAHVELRHPVAAFQYAKAVIGSDADEAAIVMAMLKLPIQSEYEFEADRRGIELAALGQYDPDAAHRLWLRKAGDGTADSAGAEGGIGGLLGSVLGGVEEILSTHPPHGSRCVRARQATVALRASLTHERYYRGATNVRERVVGPKRAY